MMFFKMIPKFSCLIHFENLVMRFTVPNGGIAQNQQPTTNVIIVIWTRVYSYY